MKKAYVGLCKVSLTRLLRKLSRVGLVTKITSLREVTYSIRKAGIISTQHLEGQKEWKGKSR